MRAATEKISSRFILPIDENLNCAPSATKASGVATFERLSRTLKMGSISVKRHSIPPPTSIARMPSATNPSATLSISGFLIIPRNIRLMFFHNPLLLSPEKIESEITASMLNKGTATADTTAAIAAPSAPHIEVASGIPISALLERNTACKTTPRLEPSRVINKASGIAKRNVASIKSAPYPAQPKSNPASESIL